MALIKTKELITGVSGEYWRVQCVSLIDGVAQAGLALYLNRAARKAGKSFIHTENFTFNIPIAEMDLKNPVKIVYEKIKTSVENKFFSDAVDD